VPRHRKALDDLVLDKVLAWQALAEHDLDCLRRALPLFFRSLPHSFV